jgi:hypothetical protein
LYLIASVWDDVYKHRTLRHPATGRHVCPRGSLS